MIILRARSLLNYLFEAEPFPRWRVSSGRCPNCHSRLFASFGRSAFLTRCIGCRANISTLSTVAVIAKLDITTLRAHEFSSYGAMFEYLRRHAGSFTCSEYFPDGAPVVGGIRNEDVTALTFENESIDLLTSNSVMEHVPDDVQGYRECYRVMKFGGLLVFTVPLCDASNTVKLASLERGRIIWHDTPEYHGSRATGPHSVPTFWRYSQHDICQRVQQVGFSRVELVDVMLSSAQGQPSKVVRAVK